MNLVLLVSTQILLLHFLVQLKPLLPPLRLVRVSTLISAGRNQLLLLCPLGIRLLLTLSLPLLLMLPCRYHHAGTPASPGVVPLAKATAVTLDSHRLTRFQQEIRAVGRAHTHVVDKTFTTSLILNHAKASSRCFGKTDKVHYAFCFLRTWNSYAAAYLWTCSRTGLWRRKWTPCRYEFLECIPQLRGH